jgi:hypothetical protein
MEVRIIMKYAISFVAVAFLLMGCVTYPGYITNYPVIADIPYDLTDHNGVIREVEHANLTFPWYEGSFEYVMGYMDDEFGEAHYGNIFHYVDQDDEGNQMIYNYGGWIPAYEGLTFRWTDQPDVWGLWAGACYPLHKSQLKSVTDYSGTGIHPPGYTHPRMGVLFIGPNPVVGDASIWDTIPSIPDFLLIHRVKSQHDGLMIFRVVILSAGIRVPWNVWNHRNLQLKLSA